VIHNKHDDNEGGKRELYAISNWLQDTGSAGVQRHTNANNTKISSVPTLRIIKILV
jgi:hypothetical protein